MFLENLFLIFAFGLSFGGILAAQFLLGEVIVYPQLHQHENFSSSSTLIIYLGLPLSIGALLFVYVGIATWLVNDKLLHYFSKTAATSPTFCCSSMTSATPSLLLLAVAWTFASFSRLNEFAVTLILFALAMISFAMVEIDKHNLLFGTLKSWISCNVVAGVGTYGLVSLVAAIVEMQQRGDEVLGINFGFKNTSLGGVLPLWTPGLLLMMTTSWGQVCRRIF